MEQFPRPNRKAAGRNRSFGQNPTECFAMSHRYGLFAAIETALRIAGQVVNWLSCALLHAVKIRANIVTNYDNRATAAREIISDAHLGERVLQRLGRLLQAQRLLGPKFD